MLTPYEIQKCFGIPAACIAAPLAPRGTTMPSGEPRRRWPWAKVDSGFLVNAARDPRLPAWLRVSYAAWAYVKPGMGVADFEPGELAELCAFGVNPKTGELSIKPDSVARHVRKALAEAVEYGHVLPGSTARRVLVDPDVAALRTDDPRR